MSGSVEYVGHATCLIDLDGSRLLTDPLLRRLVGHLRRVAPLDSGVLQGVDAVLISHAHLDHLDLPSLLRLGREMPLVVPRGVAGLLRRRRLARVTEVQAGDELRLGALTVRATHAHHAGGRSPLMRASPALGYVVTGSSSVYFAGDTELFDEMDGLVHELDVALLPVWGWGEKLGAGLHLDPERAAEAVRRLRPRFAIPIHWGTYLPAYRGLRRRPGFLRAPADEFAAAVGCVAPDVAVRVLAPGERLELF